MYDFARQLPDFRAALESYTGPHQALIQGYINELNV